MLAGCIAVGYAVSIAYRKWWLLLVPLAVHFYLASAFIFPLLRSLGWVSYVSAVEADGLLARRVAVVGTVIALAVGQFFMVRFISVLARRSEHDRAELEVAQRMHTRIVPAVKVETPTMIIDGTSTTSSSMGGDLCDVVQVRDQTYAVIADVCGHGVGAGLIMTMVKGCVRTRLVQGGELGDIVADINRVLCQQLSDGSFVTLAIARVTETGVELAQAGHPPALVVSASGAKEIENRSVPLGLLEDEHFHATSVSLEPGESLVLYTDGLFERPAAEEVFSEAQLGIPGLAAMLVAAQARGGMSACATMPLVQGPQPPADDQTLIVMRRR